MKQAIRLTESDLRRIVKESVKRLLRESNLSDHNYTLPSGGFDLHSAMYDSALRNAESIDDWDEKMKEREESAKMDGDSAQFRHPQRNHKYGSVGASIYVNPERYATNDTLKTLAHNAEYGREKSGFPY